MIMFVAQTMQVIIIFGSDMDKPSPTHV